MLKSAEGKLAHLQKDSPTSRKRDGTLLLVFG
jgi:hypothetical protein